MGNGTPLGRVRGLGASHHGTGHWLQQRLTALGNVLLVTWFVVSLLRLPLGDHAALMQWASKPMVAFALILLVVSVFWHLRLGLQVLIEDYVHDEGLKLASIVLLSFFAIGGAVFALFSIASIAFGAPHVG